MKFLVNLCLSPKVVTHLLSLEHTATRVSQLGMSEAKDKEILEYAIHHDMILLTADLDFGQILAYTHSNRPSVVIFRLKNPVPENVNKYILHVISKFKRELEEGCIAVVEDTRIRVRSLPIS